MAYNRTLQHFTSSQELATVWASGQNYIVNQLVIESNKLYRCTVAHTSGATFAGDSANWSGLNPGQTVSISEGGTGQTTQTAAFDALAPTTTAGDIIVHNGTDNVRQAIGSDGQVLVVDTTAGNKLKWATLQQGAKNYIQYGTFENNALTGWNEASVTWSSGSPSGAPTISATAAASITLAVTNTNPLAGSYSLQMVGTIAQGQGFCTDALTIDREDQAKVLQGSFYYEVVSGATSSNWSGTSSNTLSVWIYDVTNSTWQQPAGVYNLVQSSGSGICSFTFQTASNASQLRMFVFAANTASGSITVNFDDFRLGPQVTAAGAAVTDWITVTAPALTASTSNPTTSASGMRYRRIGDSAEIQWYYAFSTAGSGSYRFQMPTGLVIDSTKWAHPFASPTGIGRLYDASLGTTSNLSTRYENATGYITMSADGISVFGSSTPIAIANTDEVWVSAIIPIVGWSSNTTMSNDTDTRVVSTTAVRSTSSQAISGSSDIKIQFNAVSYDKTGSFDSITNYRFTAPSSGVYVVAGKLFTTNTAASVAQYVLLYKNGVQNTELGRVTTSTAVTSQIPLAASIELNAGDYLEVYINPAGQASNIVSSAAIYGGSQVSFTRVSGPATIAATETVAARYVNGAGTTIAAGSPGTVVPFATKDYDTHNFFNGATGVATIPVSGKYRIQGNIYLAGASFTTASKSLSVRVNGTHKAFISIFGSAAVTAAIGFNGSMELNLNAGDTVDLQLAHNESTTRNLDLATGANYICITRVGN